MSIKTAATAAAVAAPIAKRLRAMAGAARSARDQAALSHAATLIEQQFMQIDSMALQLAATTQDLIVARANWRTLRNVLRDTLEVTS